MWVLCSNQNAACVRPFKPSKGEEGDKANCNPSFWIRPGRTYTAGRAEAFDLYVTHLKLSRKKPGFVLHSTAVEPAATQIQEERDTLKPTYELNIQAGEQGLLILDVNGADVEIKPGSEYTIRDGVKINVFADKKRECIMTFRWRPVHIFNRISKKKELPALQETLAPMGITFSTYLPNTTPNHTHTHAMFAKLYAEPGAAQVIAANCQLLMVHAGWIEALVLATKPEMMALGDEEDKKLEKSLLELDFERHWPSEVRYFPKIDGREATAAEQKMWLPDPRRRDLLKDTVFIDCSADMNIPFIVTTAGGNLIKPDLKSDEGFTESVERFFKDTAIDSERVQKFVIYPFWATLFTPEEYVVIVKAKTLARFDGYIGAVHVFTAIKNVAPIRESEPTYGLLERASRGDDQPAPTPSMPGATADISFPATHPGDVAASAPVLVQPVQAAAKQSEAASVASEGRPNKKPRKLADRGVIDPFATMFAAPSTATSAPAVPCVTEHAKESQAASQASSVGSRGTTSIAPLDSQSQAKYLRPDSKYSKLKRRVGQGSTSQLTPLSELQTPEEEVEEPPTKKFKTFDPSIESITSQATARLKEKEKQETLARLLVGAEGENVKPSKSKRKVAEMEADSEEEPAMEATQSTSRKKAAHSKEEAKTSKKKPEEPSKSAHRESVYLQVKTGRRKIGKADADINEDFNNLRLKKSQIPESHKMGWNERDVFQEEMAEDAVWEAEDKSTFFQIRFVPMARAKDANAPQAVAAADPRYVGKPNFKAFQPKASSSGGSSRQVPRTRPLVELVTDEALGYGLKESYGDGEGPRDNTSHGLGYDSDVSIEMPMPDLGNPRKGRGKAKAKPAAKATSRAKGKRAVVSESSEEDQLDEDDESATAPEESVPVTGRSKAKESITIDSSDEEEDGRTFRGFGASNKITARKR